DFARFIALPQLSLLTHLDLLSCAIGDAGVRALAQSPSLSRLTSLGLGGNLVSDEGLESLANSPFLRCLTTLDLAGNPCADGAADRLRRRFGLDIRLAPLVMPLDATPARLLPAPAQP